MGWLRVLFCYVLALGMVVPLVTRAQTVAEETAPTTANYTGAASITYAGNWTQGSTLLGFSGGTGAFSNSAPARVTLSFNGTGVSWIGFRGPMTGIARVFLDGVQEAEVDTFAPADGAQVVLYRRDGLADGAHTLAIEVTGTKNLSSTDAYIVVDAFDISGTPTGRIQETGPGGVSYTGNWNQGNTDLAWSGGTAAYTGQTGSRATLIFNGTGVSWIGFQGPQTGIANVYVDGVLAATVDTYAPTDTLQATLFTSSVLAEGIHTLAIEVTGTKNESSTDTLIAVDAFSITP
jgi:hypothetical protein